MTEPTSPGAVPGAQAGEMHEHVHGERRQEAGGAPVAATPVAAAPVAAAPVAAPPPVVTVAPVAAPSPVTVIVQHAPAAAAVAPAVESVTSLAPAAPLAALSVTAVKPATTATKTTTVQKNEWGDIVSSVETTVEKWFQEGEALLASASVKNFETALVGDAKAHPGVMAVYVVLGAALGAILAHVFNF